jgi:hypothetical protein
MRMTSRPGIERGFERILFASRWLMAPMYLGLVAGLGMLVFIFLRDLGYYLPKLLAMKSDDAILVALTLIDLTLAANLVLIVMFSGYENFVSKFDFDDPMDRSPAFLTSPALRGRQGSTCGGRVANVVKLSSNENPFGASDRRKRPSARGPQPAPLSVTDHADLREAIAEVHGLDAAGSSAASVRTRSSISSARPMPGRGTRWCSPNTAF